ncbi:hypothetical protein MSAN_02176900 [Mycena sanguinolenta]|uniref:LYR motif-containing protein Cup1-like N-terminal domain-containing protein n=1 Tax=Mycena sanguinolenta TaxID=230812 RepID=A0A8H6XFK6_9AGAR|nr:hypothetical protein MSAN_02176900 [Mycena sanguinolenta]
MANRHNLTILQKYNDGILKPNRVCIVQVFPSPDKKIAPAISSVCLQFWRIKGADDVRAILDTENLRIRNLKVKRMAKDVRKLEASSKRSSQAFQHVLDVAYGRKGKLKRELIEPILTDPTARVPPKIIPAVESSRPPVYSKEMRALLTSALSRSAGKGLPERSLDFPPKLPARADPKSEEARILGPFSKRRETNTRWQYFVEQTQTVRPPLQVVVEDIPSGTHGTAPGDLRRVGVRGLPMQGLRVFEDVQVLATSPHKGPQRTSIPVSPSAQPRIPRWIRRRYEKLLDEIPTLTYRVPAQKNPPRYLVSASTSGVKTVDAAVSDLEWLEGPTQTESAETDVLE